ncbi:choice-of-anchor C family protein [Streptomyces sp. NBC_01571]|uniref:choice-of-anchor C family protein n=1 Tax=Streptomyces sp. NBC_01571 TaxID=2975883 RepID=UPI00224E0E04|nr:choice-of-anchor C family protein [Streptomyces sp. NBC_01571]MCX4581333.1 choice-of-anchor C family protein [Streptomyces sp. NBC_01571]
MFAPRVSLVAAAVSVLLAGAGAAVAAPAKGPIATHGLAASSLAFSRFDDGSFETPTVPPATFQTFTAGQTIGPWQVTSGTADLIGAGYWQAAEGDQSLDLNGNNPGSVSQTFTTVPGTQYTVTYALAGNFGGPPTVKTGQVRIDGQDVQNFSFDVTGKTRTNMGYINRQVTFVATGTSTTLSFASTTPNSAWGPVIDDVTVKPCPPCPTCG